MDPDAQSSAHATETTTAKRSPLSSFWREVGTFGVIGIINAIIDLGLYVVLKRHGPLEGKVATAKFVSGAVATVFAWVGNRFWTYRDRESRPVHHEVALFFGVNAVALLATTGWVAFAHYVLHAHGSFWDLFHAIVGIGIGTVIRFLLYRTVVFGPSAEDPAS